VRLRPSLPSWKTESSVLVMILVRSIDRRCSHFIRSYYPCCTSIHFVSLLTDRRSICDVDGCYCRTRLDEGRFSVMMMSLSVEAFFFVCSNSRTEWRSDVDNGMFYRLGWVSALPPKMLHVSFKTKPPRGKQFHKKSLAVLIKTHSVAHMRRRFQRQQK
jgi:hypothetical protein